MYLYYSPIRRGARHSLSFFDFQDLTSLFLLLLSLAFNASAALAGLKVGTGIADITGAPLGTTLMGYGDPAQRTRGIHLRLYSRAFAVEETESHQLIVIVSADILAISGLVRKGVIDKLQSELGSPFHFSNVMLTATHTHSAPGGHAGFFLLDLNNLGFDSDSYRSVVDGIVQSIKLAYQNLRPGKILINEGKLYGANVNRSYGAYLKNPDANREDDVNKNMTLLKFLQTRQNTGEASSEVGTLNWFAVHPTSMDNKNFYISGDNKGYAAYLFEKERKAHSLLAQEFVAGFANSDEGDSSPEVFDAKIFPEPPPSLAQTAMPGLDEFKKTEIIGARQFRKALELYQTAQEELEPQILYRYLTVHLPSFVVAPQFSGLNEPVQLCRGTLGEAFGAGSSDRPTTHAIQLGSTQENPSRLPWYLKLVRLALGQGNNTDAKCQYPKALFVGTGQYQTTWIPETLPFQIFKIGSLAIVAAPAEVTTAAGRRIRKLVFNQLEKSGVRHVVLAGLANNYSLYLTTREEYAAQYYEGGATLFGPHTLSAYLQIYAELAQSIADHRPSQLPGAVAVGIQDGPSFRYPFGVVADGSEIIEKMGSVVQAPKAIYSIGDTVSVSFRSGDPRNTTKNLRTYFEIQKLENKTWIPKFYDGDPETLSHWHSGKFLKGGWREVLQFPFRLTFAIDWKIPEGTEEGTYRVIHRGTWKSFGGRLKNFSGKTAPFAVINSGVKNNLNEGI